MAKDTDITKLSTEELEARRDELATQRTEIREQQVAVQAELDMRQALAAMPAASRDQVIHRLKLEGVIDVSSERDASSSQKEND